MTACKEYKILDKQLKLYCGSGVRSTFFKNILAPNWWSESLANNKNLVFSLIFSVARKLGVSISFFMQEGAEFCADGVNVAYKMKSIDSFENLSGTASFLFNVAKNILSGIEKQDNIPTNALEIYKHISNKASCVDFFNLLDYCWDLKIPVLYINEIMPKSQKTTNWHKPCAVTFRYDNKYCIFLTKKNTYQAEYLFPLAHEIGHIALNHLTEDSYLFDNKIEKGSKDKNEISANDFAEKILCGENKVIFHDTYCPDSLAYDVIEKGKFFSIDPSYLALNYAFIYNKFSMAFMVLNKINQDSDKNPVSLIKSKTFQNINKDNYSEEQYNYISRVSDLQYSR